MSLNLSFNNNLFLLKKLSLPSRYFYFTDEQNYIKLLTIGEGFFPKDRIRTSLEFIDSDVICTTESATKIYLSKKEFAISKIDIDLKNSNLEFINDELILHGGAKFIQLLNFKYDDQSTFFYGDILSHGRSYEEFDFSYLGAKNTFKENEKIEYLEKYILSNDMLHSYLQDTKTSQKIFAKIYIKTKDNEVFLNSLIGESFTSFTFTKSKSMLIGVLSDNSMVSLKKQLQAMWTFYRKSLHKKQFNLGKQ